MLPYLKSSIFDIMYLRMFLCQVTEGDQNTMFEAGFAYILSKSLMNTRTKNPRSIGRGFLLFTSSTNSKIPYLSTPFTIIIKKSDSEQVHLTCSESFYFSRKTPWCLFGVYYKHQGNMIQVYAKSIIIKLLLFCKRHTFNSVC